MSTELNRKRPYSQIYGHSVAKFFQDGKYFDGGGRPVSAQRAALPSDMTGRELEEIRKESGIEDETMVQFGDDDPEGGTEPVGGAEVDPAADIDRDAETDDGGGAATLGDDEAAKAAEAAWNERFTDAMGMHHTALASMCEMLYEELQAKGKAPEEKAPFTGTGSKERNAKWLATYAE